MRFHTAVTSGRSEAGAQIVDVAVVMAAHNEERYIERALRSCLAQSIGRAAYEVIVIDDGSTDATAKIAERSDVVMLRNETQLGLPASVNRAIWTSVNREMQPRKLVCRSSMHWLPPTELVSSRSSSSISIFCSIDTSTCGSDAS